MGKIVLLSKSDIAKAQSADKAKEIAEGLKISRRVDSLRELKAKEEQELEKFRNESLAAINAEIVKLDKQKEELATELVGLRRELASETKLSKEERLHLEDLKEKLEKKERELKDKSDAIDLKEIDIAIVLKSAENSLARQLSHERIAEDLDKKASERETKASQKLVSAEKIEENALKFKKDTEEALSLRENGIVLKEKANLAKEQENNAKEKELAKEKIQLADQRATLERALKRLKDNRLA